MVGGHSQRILVLPGRSYMEGDSDADGAGIGRASARSCGSAQLRPLKIWCRAVGLEVSSNRSLPVYTAGQGFLADQPPSTDVANCGARLAVGQHIVQRRSLSASPGKACVFDWCRALILVGHPNVTGRHEASCGIDFSRSVVYGSCIGLWLRDIEVLSRPKRRVAWSVTAYVLHFV
nr:hypothetical protein CFP56_21319 [Quercus suber]